MQVLYHLLLTCCSHLPLLDEVCHLSSDHLAVSPTCCPQGCPGRGGEPEAHDCHRVQAALGTCHHGLQ